MYIYTEFRGVKCTFTQNLGVQNEYLHRIKGCKMYIYKEFRGIKMNFYTEFRDVKCTFTQNSGV